MLNRDFTKSNKEYFNKNKWPLIAVAVFLLVGIVIACIFGFRGNFELAGATEFTVRIGSTANVNECSASVKSTVNAYGGSVEDIAVFDDGDETRLVIRYSNDVNEVNQAKINDEIVTKLSLSSEDVVAHRFVAPTVRAKHYIFAAAVILILLVVASIFTAVRYNFASMIALLISCAVGTLGYLSISAILRLTIGLSYFAMLVALNVLITYVCLNYFEKIRRGGWLVNGDYESAVKSTMKSSRFSLIFVASAIMLAGLLFVVAGPSAIKYVSINIMFMAVVVLGVALYILPFFWSVLITHKNSKVAVKK
ncbi:MAG: hypothetical protein MJ149_01245 [Clostridia bacterium]|nr:hypothetical protein [Clostridia bacterium]